MTEKFVIALGFFDGVHRGHQELLKACRNLADQQGCRAAAVTFSSHPDTLVFGKTPGLINTPADRRWLLRHYGMDEVIELPFDRAMMKMPWQDFFRMLVEKYHAAGLVCGHDFHFGDRGAGNPQILQQACGEAGIPCHVVTEQKIDGVTISSTHIRSLIQEGLMGSAAEFLGHAHVLSGEVVKGHQLGRTLGIPTANLRLPEGIICPRFGVYACRVEIDGRDYCAVTNVGSRPTVNGTGITVEPWILDYEGDLYGRTLYLRMYYFLRPEQKFPDLDTLKRTIEQNAQQTREYFANLQKPDFL